MIAWWPFDKDPLGEGVSVAGMTTNTENAKLYNAEVTTHGRFGKGIRFQKDKSDARMLIHDGVDIESSWTLSSWSEEHLTTRVLG